MRLDGSCLPTQKSIHRLWLWPGSRPLVVTAEEHNLGCQLNFQRQVLEEGVQARTRHRPRQKRPAWFLGKTSGRPGMKTARSQQYCSWGLQDGAYSRSKDVVARVWKGGLAGFPKSLQKIFHMPWGSVTPPHTVFSASCQSFHVFSLSCRKN